MVRWWILACVTAACGRVSFDPLSDGISGNPALVVDVSTPVVVGNVASATLTFPSAPATGNVIVVSTWSYHFNATTGFGVSSVSDSSGNSYAVAAAYSGAPTACDGVGMAAVGMFYAKVETAAAPFSITVTPTGGGSQEIGAVGVEVTGISGVLDDASTMDLVGTPSPMRVETSPIAVTQNGALIVSVANACSGYPNVGTWSDNAAFAIRAQNGATQTTQPGIAGDKVAPTAGSYAAQWLFTYMGAGPNPAIAAIAAFR